VTAPGRIVIAGGTGFLGRSLARHLADAGSEIILVSRHLPADDHGLATDARVRHAPWDARTLGDWARHLDGAAALVNLVGRSVDCVKTPDHCDEILRSRVESTAVLGLAVRGVKSPPRVWVQMSTAHIYGDPVEIVCDEDAALGYGLAPFVGRAWEETFEQASPPGIRRVVLRTSFVLGRHSGALPKLARLARWGLGGRVGHGRQGMSWIHLEDMNRLFARAITHDGMQGVYLATAPAPVSSAEFMRALRHAVGTPFGLPTPSWLVRIAAPLLMRTDPELALYGRYCVSRRLREEGFEFRFPDLASALRDLYL
jgi:uncharacterized protein (TIGR01777 family)